MPSILFPARAVVEGDTISRRPTPAATAAPASAVLARNWRRFRYRLRGVISDERMSSAFLISMLEPRPLYASALDRFGLPLSSIFHQIGRDGEKKVTGVKTDSGRMQGASVESPHFCRKERGKNGAPEDL